MKGISAMSYLDPKVVTISTGLSDCSMESIKAAVYKMAELQQTQESFNELEVNCVGSNPYFTSVWSISANGNGIGSSASLNVVGVQAGDTVTVNGLVYTAVSGAKADNTEFSIDGDNTASATDLADSITNDTREGTVAEATLSASSNTNQVFIEASGVDAVVANTITLTSSNGTRLPVNSATLQNGADFVANFDSEDSQSLSADAKGRPALSSRRAINFNLDTSDLGFAVTFRSIVSVLRFVEKLEDKVAKTGTSSEADGTYTEVELYGATPYESFVWTIEKLGGAYTVTPTANS